MPDAVVFLTSISHLSCHTPISSECEASEILYDLRGVTRPSRISCHDLSVSSPILPIYNKIPAMTNVLGDGDAPGVAPEVSGYDFKCLGPEGGTLWGFSFSNVLLEMSLIILITRAVRFLLKPLRQPRIVSEMIGGIIVGPSVLCRSRSFKSYVFPGESEFLVKNLGVAGFMYFLFMTGIKIDLSAAFKSGKRLAFVGSMGVILPAIIVSTTAFSARNILDNDLSKTSSILAVSSAVAMTSLPVIFPILEELNLVNSELGRVALSVTLFGDVLGLAAIMAFEASAQAEVSWMGFLMCLMSSVFMLIFIFVGLRRLIGWIIRKTPEGAPVEQHYVVAILLGVLVIGFLTDLLGLAIANGPFLLGLMIPDGPPLGVALVDRCETIVANLLMPFAFCYVGLYTDVFSMSESWRSLYPLFGLVAIGYLTKAIVTLLVALFVEIPWSDALALSLITNLRGQVDILLYIHWMDKKIIGHQSFTLLVLMSALTTVISTPLIGVFYDPTRPYRINTRRTIQHAPLNAEFRVVVTVHNHENAASFIKLLEFSNPTTSGSFSVYSIHVVEQAGRALPALIDHDKQVEYSKHTIHDTFHKALKTYEETRSDCMTLHAFTSVSPKKSMYQDICELALKNKADLILLPFYDGAPLGSNFVWKWRLHSMNINVLDNAPCSVGILVDKVHLRMKPFAKSDEEFKHNVVVLFLGGADAREALAFADRMVGHPKLRITVVRFLASNGMGDDRNEKKLDDGMVGWFYMRNKSNGRVEYREAEVRNGEETVAAIQGLNKGTIDLWMVGRGQGTNPILLEGMGEWYKAQGLGMIGDYIMSEDFQSDGSVLVVQQQVLREQKRWLSRWVGGTPPEI